MSEQATDSATPTATATEAPKCGAIFDAGIRNSRDLIRGLGALMGDLAASRVVPARANAICNAAGKILTTVHLEYKFGASADGGADGVPQFSLEPGPAPRRAMLRRGATTGRPLEAPRARATTRR
jgi:hypothetical protein